jgi:hypothetical protein
LLRVLLSKVVQVVRSGYDWSMFSEMVIMVLYHSWSVLRVIVKYPEELSYHEDSPDTPDSCP